MKEFFAPKLALLMVLIVFGLPVNAQTDCVAKLDSAKMLFNSGQIEEIPSLLEPCLRIGFAKQDKIQAYLLLIQVYLFDSNREKAQQIMSEFLHSFPDYDIQPSDPTEFIELYKTFRVKPIWGIGIAGSINASQVLVKQHYSTDNLNKLNSKYSPDILGFDGGLHICKFFKSNIWISADFQYSITNLKRKDILGVKNEALNYSESTGWFTAPVYLSYSIGRGRIAPYIYAGGEAGYLFVDKSYIVRQNLVDNSIPNIEQKSTDNRLNRKSFNAWALGGVGLLYKTMGGYFNLSIGYRYSLMPFVKKENRYANINSLYYYQYIDDDFRINRFSCSIGYTKVFYKIKK